MHWLLGSVEQDGIRFNVFPQDNWVTTIAEAQLYVKKDVFEIVQFLGKDLLSGGSKATQKFQFSTNYQSKFHLTVCNNLNRYH